MTSAVSNHQLPSILSYPQSSLSYRVHFDTHIILDDDSDLIMYVPIKKHKGLSTSSIVYTIPDDNSDMEVCHNMSIERDMKNAVDPRKKMIQSQCVKKYQKKQSIEIITLDSDSEDTSDEVVFVPSPDFETLKCSNTLKSDSNRLLFDGGLLHQMDVSENKNLGAIHEFSTVGSNFFENVSPSDQQKNQLNSFVCFNKDSTLSKIKEKVQSFIPCKDNDAIIERKESSKNKQDPVTSSKPVPKSAQKSTSQCLESYEFEELVIPKVDLGGCAVIPKLVSKNSKGQEERIKRKLKSIWNPERLDNAVLENYLDKMSQATGIKVTNQEKGLKMLIKFDMNINEVVSEIKKNQFFYKNHFRPDSRLLRNKLVLL